MQLPRFKSVIQLLDYFKEDSVCRSYLERQRWNNKPCCPHCGAEKPYRTNRGFKCSNNQCYKKFSVTVGTIFENTKIPLRYWFAALHVATAHKKGISSYQLSRDLGVSQKTAWFMLHRIREMMKDEAPELLENTVEVDATYMGGKVKNMHAKKREAVTKMQGRGTGGKTAVLGVLQRDSKEVMQVVKSEAATATFPAIYKLVSDKATVMSPSRF